MNALVVQLGLSRRDFSANAEAAKADMNRLKGEVGEVAGALAILQRQARAAGDAVDAGLTARIKQTQAALTGLQSDLRTATTDSAILNGPEPKPGRDEHGGNGNERMAGMEAGHSVRSIADALGAGMNPGQAFMMELPRLLQAAGKGVGAMIGVEAGASIFRSIVAAYEKARQEREEFSKAMAGPGIGVSSNSALQSRMSNAASERDKLMPEGQSNSLIDWVGRQMKNVTRGIKGDKSVEDEQDDKIVALEQSRVAASEELAKRKADEVELDTAAFERGEDTVAMEREQLKLREQIRDVMSDPNMDGTAAAKMIETLREQERVQERIKQVEIDRKDARRQLERDEATIAHPKINGPDGTDQLLNVPPEFSRNRSLARKLAERDEKVDEEEAIKRGGGDTRDAHNAVLRSESGLRDAAIDEEMKTPAERRRDTHMQARRDQAEQRLIDRAKMHAGVDAANDTRGSFDAFFHKQPNRQPSVQPNRQVSAADAAHKAATKDGFKGSLGTVESLLTQIKENATWKGK